MLCATFFIKNVELMVREYLNPDFCYLYRIGGMIINDRVCVGYGYGALLFVQTIYQCLSVCYFLWSC